MIFLHDREPPTPAFWDATYDDVGKWKNPSPEIRDHQDKALALIGDVRGRSVLDLGGGCLLAARLFAAGARRVVVVDHSARACEVVHELEPRAECVVGDVIEYVEHLKEKFDVAVGMGIFEYVHPRLLDVVFRAGSRGWYNRIVVYIPAVEGYLDYDTRTTIHTESDVIRTSAVNRWMMDNRHPSREHVFASYRRRR